MFFFETQCIYHYKQHYRPLAMASTSHAGLKQPMCCMSPKSPYTNTVHIKATENTPHELMTLCNHDAQALVKSYAHLLKTNTIPKNVHSHKHKSSTRYISQISYKTASFCKFSKYKKNLNIHFVENLILFTTCEFYYNYITVTSSTLCAKKRPTMWLSYIFA